MNERQWLHIDKVLFLSINDQHINYITPSTEYAVWSESVDNLIYIVTWLSVNHGGVIYFIETNSVHWWYMNKTFYTAEWNNVE